jgi:hypothetical protein
MTAAELKVLATKYAAYPSLRLYDALNVPYVLFDGPWSGPLWTGHCMMLSTRDGYGDEGFAHELFHYLVTDEKQRRWPDFALGRQVNADMNIFTSSSTPNLFDRSVHNQSGFQPTTRNDGWGETTISLKRASDQEAAACNAMWLYPPLVGLCSWDEPFPTTGLDAAHDFAGMEYPGSNEWKTTTIAKRCLPIVAAIYPSVSPETVTDYLRRLNAAGTAERFS